MLLRPTLHRFLTTSHANSLTARSIFATQVSSFSRDEEPVYETCSKHGTRRIVRYLQQDQYGYWSCRPWSTCISKETAQRDSRNHDQAACSVHSRLRAIRHMRFNPNTKLWECRPNHPCQ